MEQTRLPCPAGNTLVHRSRRELHPNCVRQAVVGVAGTVLLSARLPANHCEAPMPSDEQEIRQLVSTWMTATKTGDVDTLLSLMSEDVVFLIGQTVMRKADFAAAALAQAGSPAPQFNGTSEIQEIRVLGDWAFMWSR